MNYQTTNNTNSSVTGETTEADTTSSPMVQSSTPQQSMRNENGNNNNSPTSELLQISSKNILERKKKKKNIFIKDLVYLYISLLCVHLTYLITFAQYRSRNLLIFKQKQNKICVVSQFYLICEHVYLYSC